MQNCMTVMFANYFIDWVLKKCIFIHFKDKYVNHEYRKED